MAQVVTDTRVLWTPPEHHLVPTLTLTLTHSHSHTQRPGLHTHTLTLTHTHTHTETTLRPLTPPAAPGREPRGAAADTRQADDRLPGSPRATLQPHLAEQAPDCPHSQLQTRVTQQKLTGSYAQP